jgi:hypothetical protein
MSPQRPGARGGKAQGGRCGGSGRTAPVTARHNRCRWHANEVHPYLGPHRN